MLRQKIYGFLTNRHPGIRERYHRIHDGTSGIKKWGSWFYLLWLNFCYYVLFMRYLDRPVNVQMYEEKRLPAGASESGLAAARHGTPEEYVEQLSHYDAVSFDIFDTLIFRPCSDPADLFYFVGEQLGILDFRRIRMEQEHAARMEKYKAEGHYEVTLRDIWERMEQETGIPATEGMMLEMQTEKRFCYANPFMQKVFLELCRRGTHIILISDMYLPATFLRELLEDKGYYGIDKIYVSCEYGKSKGVGSLYACVRNELDAGNTGAIDKAIVSERTDKNRRSKWRYAHVGDNEKSDVIMAQRQGFDAFYYPNINAMSYSYRPYDMSPVTGGAYRGIVNARLYNGCQTYSMEYEYGYVYGGLFVLGYCNFIHEYAVSHHLDKVLFLSRDGDILEKVYHRMFPKAAAEYVYWSRMAATKLMAEYNRYDYFRRFLYHKVNQKKTLGEVLRAMELDWLGEQLSDACTACAVQNENAGENVTLLRQEDFLTDKNVDFLKAVLLSLWPEVLESYREQSEAAEKYYRKVLDGCKNVGVVDIGWAGSGSLSLGYLAERVWNLPCRITGIVAGTNTVHNAEPEASEVFLQSGKLISYLYSSRENRDLMKKHDINKGYNLYWELLCSSPSPQFLGFYLDKEGRVQKRFGRMEENVEGIQEIQKGIRDFTEDYLAHFGDIPYMLRISGRDAYAPFLIAAGKGEAYLKAVYSGFHLDMSIGDGKN